MKTYHVDTPMILFSFLLATIFLVIFFWVRELSTLWLVGIFAYGTFFELNSTVALDDKGISTSLGVLPFFPRLRRSLLWSEVTEVRPLLNLFFVEADALTITARPPSGKPKHLLIPIAVLANRRDFLKQLSNSLPAHAQVAPDISTWVSSVGTTPKWQLAIAMTVILVLATILWFQMWHGR